jgi:hypothetical protein
MIRGIELALEVPAENTTYRIYKTRLSSTLVDSSDKKSTFQEEARPQGENRRMLSVEE